MFDNIMRWYTRNYVQITWFIIGWLSLAFLDNFGRGDWFSCLIDAGLIWLNYHLVTR
mgnify:CR=1 FL=1